MRQSTSSAVEVLTARERDILAKLARGYTYAETAEILGVAASTVQSHVKNIYSKLVVHSKTEAIYEARQLAFVVCFYSVGCGCSSVFSGHGVFARFGQKPLMRRKVSEPLMWHTCTWSPKALRLGQGR